MLHTDSSKDRPESDNTLKVERSDYLELRLR
jgi:hypothetical protein